MSFQATLKPSLSKAPGSKTKSVYRKDEKVDMNSFKNINEEFSMVTSFLSDSHPMVISLPYLGNWLEVMEDNRHFVFVSATGMLAVIDSNLKTIISDVLVSKQSLTTIGIADNGKFLYVAGQEAVIWKFKYEGLVLEEEFRGHTGQINSVIISLDNQWMVSCSDDYSVRYWSLTKRYPNKVLYSHKGKVTCMELSSDNNYIVTAGTDFKVFVYEIAWEVDSENGRVLTMFESAPAKSLKISFKNTFIAIGHEDGTIDLIGFGSWNLIRKFVDFSGTQHGILSIDVTKDERLMVTAGESENIVFWELYKESNSPAMEMKYHEKAVTSANFISDGEYVLSMGNDCKVVRNKVPHFDEIRNVDTKDLINMFGVGEKVLALYDNEIRIFDFRGNMSQIIEIPRYEQYFVTSDDHLFLYSHIGYNDDKYNYKITEFDLAIPFKSLFEYEFSSAKMCSAITSSALPDGSRYTSIGQLYKINTYKLKDGIITAYNSQIYHESDIYYICISPDNSFLFSASNDIIKKIDIKKMADPKLKNVLCKISDHRGQVLDMKCTSDSNKLLILSENSFIIWSIGQEAVIKSSLFSNHPVRAIKLSKLYNYFFIQCESSLEMWSFQDFNKKTVIAYGDLKCFTLFLDEKMIAINYNSKTEFFESPLYSKHVKIIGENLTPGLKKEFFKYVNEIRSGKSKYYDDRYKNWIILPFMINIQHIYAYYNYVMYLKYALIPGLTYTDKAKNSFTSIGDAPYLKSIKSHTVLSISLHQDFPECVKVALKCMKARWPSNPYSLVTVSDSLIALNNSGLDGLQKLYDFALREHFFTTLPRFCSGVSLPVIKYSDSIEVDYDVMLGVGTNIVDGTALTFEHSCFKVIMSLGSSEGVDFMESIADCKNERIFESKFIRLILSEKWRRVRIIMYLQAFVYLCYVVTLAIFSTKFLENKSFLIIPAGINVYLLLYEFYQMYSGGVDYFKDIWNHVDLVRSSLFFIYAILVWVEYFKNHTDFLALIILITWVRGVTYFRIFGPTRYLINLLFEVFIDIPSFLVIFFYAIFAFSFIFFAVKPVGDYYLTLATTYSTSLGNSGFSDFDGVTWVFYVLITLFNFIIMLNLLISILSDTYERVNERQKIADGKELASMIMEVELMMFWKKDKSVKEYIHVCRDESAVEVEESTVILNKFKAMNENFNEYETNVENKLAELTEIRSTVLQENVIFSEMVREAKEKFNLK